MKKKLILAAMMLALSPNLYAMQEGVREISRTNITGLRPALGNPYQQMDEDRQKEKELFKQQQLIRKQRKMRVVIGGALAATTMAAVIMTYYKVLSRTTDENNDLFMRCVEVHDRWTCFRAALGLNKLIETFSSGLGNVLGNLMFWKR